MVMGVKRRISPGRGVLLAFRESLHKGWNRLTPRKADRHRNTKEGQELVNVGVSSFLLVQVAPERM